MRLPLWFLRCRLGIQAAVLIVVCLLPWLNAGGWRWVMGNFYALDVAGVPFSDPLSLIQTLAGGFLPGARLWIGGGIALLLALLAGRIFCGWICPYGLLSELIWLARGRKNGRLDRGQGWNIRAGVTLAGLMATALLGVPLLNAISGPGLLSLAPQMAREDVGLLLATLAPVGILLGVEVVTGRRYWCRYVCPQALMLMAAVWVERFLGKWGMAVRWTPEACTCKGAESPCAKVCSLGLSPRRPTGPDRAHCVQCGDCVTTCARHGGALHLEMGAKHE